MSSENTWKTFFVQINVSLHFVNRSYIYKTMFIVISNHKMLYLEYSIFSEGQQKAKVFLNI